MSIEEVVDEPEEPNLQLEWIQEESFEPDESFFDQSRKKKKGTRKANRITPLKVRGKQAQEAPDLRTKRGKKYKS